jgi:hypothetical protein
VTAEAPLELATCRNSCCVGSRRHSKAKPGSSLQAQRLDDTCFFKVPGSQAYNAKVCRLLLNVLQKHLQRISKGFAPSKCVASLGVADSFASYQHTLAHFNL